MEYFPTRNNDTYEVAATNKLKITNFNIVAIFIAIVMRLVAIIINWYLAFEYWKSENYVYCAWTIGSIIVPMVVTSLIYLNILISYELDQDYMLDMGILWNIAFSYLFRDGYTLVWAIKCNQAVERGDKDAQIKYYRKSLKEECNVGLIRLFDSFLESAPQKILQLAIIWRNVTTLTYFRGFTFAIYFGSIAWCLVAYNRSNRLVQLDKYDIGQKGLIFQFCFLLCFTVSRTVFIAYMASIFPFYTFLACVAHVILCGTLVFIVDEPKFAGSALCNYLFSITFGVVYLFIFIPIRDASTRNKYLIYLTLCLLENVTICILYIPLYISIFIIGLYICAIIVMTCYYACYHPRTAMLTDVCLQ